MHDRLQLKHGKGWRKREALVFVFFCQQLSRPTCSSSPLLRPNTSVIRPLFWARNQQALIGLLPCRAHDVSACKDRLSERTQPQGGASGANVSSKQPCAHSNNNRRLPNHCQRPMATAHCPSICLQKSNICFKFCLFNAEGRLRAFFVPA